MAKQKPDPKFATAIRRAMEREAAEERRTIEHAQQLIAAATVAALGAPLRRPIEVAPGGCVERGRVGDLWIA